MTVASSPTPRQELGDEPRLADARGAENREQVARALPDGSLVGLLERGELALASDHRRVEAPGPAGQVFLAALSSR